ncbi:substrate import-associated zinc metallohydrolase lipoprotein [Flavihumibacter petaseus]|uniref:Substrate import-associated zinc metallohydrolase lipoprotein n=1 Tax=Flavihumibacter petaseus NBRC 106054 TaxID=1220578 RepID=A0A0E9N276_9BACT|nr:substrate import-associated zinc metallohydrolase lipoprotein [Flavihumibacter petaseus]GAO43929.1 hypothetical protein FPE01S_02_10350 [Flavihumibacter petaseus NBRC 106054]
MKSVQYLFLLLIAGLAGLSSCKKDNVSGNADDIPGLGGDEWVNGPVDDWLFTNYTQVYNVDVKYKWSQTELSELNKFVVPVDEAQVIPVMTAIKDIWVTPYEQEAGGNFMKQYMPRFIILFGSPSYNSDGSFTLGQAEGEGRILLFDLNNFRSKGMPGYEPVDSLTVKEMFHTIEHEFGHTLHFNIMYPVEFKTITGGYTSNWNNNTNAQAREQGFISNYAMNGPDDDFVETIAFLLVEGQSWFQAMLATIESDEGRTKLQQKAAMVEDYYHNAWNINFRSLQTRTRAAIIAYTK